MILRIALFCLLSFPALAETIHIEGPDGTLKAIHDVEIARTPEEREKGLMNRKELLKNSGMVFVFDPPQRNVKMWMKNTLIPLDILFTDNTGRVFHIEEKMKPHDLTPRGPGMDDPESVLALEVPAGTVKARGIAIGDRIIPLTEKLY